MIMTQQNYNVIMKTPLGDRSGMLELFFSEAKISGYLNILRRKEPVAGELNRDGTCRLMGKFVTLMSEFYFEATGRISGDSIELTLRRGNSVFEMKGIATAQAEQEQGE